jgi:riboflavin biosynthesis pyrimidine reductase
MGISVDGRIVTAGWPGRDVLMREYERIHREYDADAWLCGRTTMEPFAGKVRPDADVARRHTGTAARLDFIAPGQFDSYAVAVDPKGKLAWTSAEIEGDHVVTVVGRGVSDDYLAFLRDRGVSYLICGGDETDLPEALEKLAGDFGIRTIMLEGGGAINGSMLQSGLVDEMSLILVPVADSRVGTAALFDADKEASPVGLTLESVERLDGGLVWLRYGSAERGA